MERSEIPHRVRVGGRALVAALAFVILLGSGWAWATFKKFTDEVPHGEPVPALADSETDVDGADQNILLVGNDSRAGATPDELVALSTTANDGVNTDTMMLLHVPAGGGKATVISFPRDSWVSVPGHGKGKLNSAYGSGYSAAKNAGSDDLAAQSAGLIMTIRTLEQLTGLHIDHYVQVNLLGFYRISNAIGGVTVCLNAAQTPETDSDQFGKGYSGINLPKGESAISGTQALAFVRQRHGLPGGDLDRIRRQQYFLSAAFHKVTSAGVLLNPFKLHDLLGAVSTSLLTDPALDVLSLAQQFQQMSAGNISYATIPNNGPQLIYPDGVETAIVQVDSAAMPGFVRTLQGLPADPDLAAAKAADPSSITVDVLNATPTAGWAAQNAERLTGDGFKVDVIDSAENFSTSTSIQYPAGAQSAAKALATALPGADLVQSSEVKRPTLVLGSDGVRVKTREELATESSSSKSPGIPSAPSKSPGIPPTSPKAAGSSSGSPTSAATPADGLGCIN